jgi:hypothetical protein
MGIEAEGKPNTESHLSIPIEPPARPGAVPPETPSTIAFYQVLL